MITLTDFSNITEEVKAALNSAFDHVRDNYQENYILFLAEGEYKPTYENQKFNPNVIDNRMDRYKDETRLKFFVQFLQTFYAFRDGTQQTDDNEQRIHMELMVYCHVWESTPFLKKLFRLTTVFDGKPYPWHVEVPAMSKHKFIREGIRDTFRNHGHPLDAIVTNGFRSQIRNAFAHSEYSFNEESRVIRFDNYEKDDVWKIESISYDEWSRFFVYSVLLAYHLVDISHTLRTRVLEDFGTDTFTIDQPDKSGALKKVNIFYNAKGDGFGFSK